jgi:hypothetical protein
VHRKNPSFFRQTVVVTAPGAGGVSPPWEEYCPDRREHHICENDRTWTTSGRGKSPWKISPPRMGNDLCVSQQRDLPGRPWRHYPIAMGSDLCVGQQRDVSPGRPWRNYPIADGKRSSLLQGGEERSLLPCRDVKDRVVLADRGPRL